MALHFGLFEERLERFEELHHAVVRLKVGEVIVDPEQYDARHFVSNGRIVKPKASGNKFETWLASLSLSLYPKTLAVESD